MANAPISPTDFAEAFKNFMMQMGKPATPVEAVFARHFRLHFDADPSKLPILAEEFRQFDHANLQMALDTWVAQPGRSFTLLGYSSPRERYGGLSLSDLIIPPGEGLFADGDTPIQGPVQYVNVALSEDRIVTCVQTALYLLRDGAERLVVLVHLVDKYRVSLQVEVMAPERPIAEKFLAELRDTMRRKNVYRGRVLTLDQQRDGSLLINPRPLPKVGKSNIILPEGLLDRIERQTIRFSQHADKLLAAGRHLRRGVLLYGPPGTGKTLTAMYLASAMSGRTVLVVTGRGMGLIEGVGAMARSLQPSTVIVEDVDLIAEERTRNSPGCNGVLFELLNEMDGLADDADILFLLTTNRPEMLEPALASRPGRVDLAIEIPVPDTESRRRLFELYRQGLRFEVKNLDAIIKRTDGVSAAFIREMVRKAALAAADERDELVVEDRHLDEALHELLIEGGGLTRSLLGAKPSERPV
jgi:ATPase family associated with various cellular activities (AAA)